MIRLILTGCFIVGLPVILTYCPPIARFMDRLYGKMPFLAKLFWDDQFEDEEEAKDDKKAPAAATAGRVNLKNNIYPFSLAHRHINRKAVK